MNDDCCHAPLSADDKAAELRKSAAEARRQGHVMLAEVLEAEAQSVTTTRKAHP